MLRCDGFYPDEDERVPYAVKVYQKSNLKHEVASADAQSLKPYREIDRLREEELPLWGKIRHPNIVTAFTLFENSGNNMYLMMQLSDMGSIADFQGKDCVMSEKIEKYLSAKLETDSREKIVQFIFKGVA